MKLIHALAFLALLIPASAFAIDSGPRVGVQIPALHATDVSGKPVDLASISGKKGVVLMFFRSAKWCPYCQKQLIEFRDAQAPLEARGYKLVGISYDAPEILTNFAKQREIGYQLISDQGSVTIDAFALRDPAYQPGHFAYGVPHPIIFIISSSGLIQAKLEEEGFKTRPPVQSVIEAVDRAGG